LFAPARLELELPALVRDVFFCFVSFLALFIFMADGQIDILDSGLLMVLFPVYMLAIYLPLQCRPIVRNRDLLHSLTMPSLEDELLTQEIQQSESENESEYSESIDQEEGGGRRPPRRPRPLPAVSLVPVHSRSGSEVETDEEEQKKHRYHPHQLLSSPTPIATSIQTSVPALSLGKGLVIVGEDGKETRLAADDVEVRGREIEVLPYPDPVPVEIANREAPPSCTVRIYRILAIPFEFLFKYTCPNCKAGEPWEDYYVLTFIISLTYLGMFSYLSVYLAQYISDAVGVPVNLEGSFVLAVGAQIPDTLASLSMAKQGLGPGAVGNAIGSQTINVLLGVGLPFFFFTLVKGEPVSVELNSTDLYVMVSGLIAVMVTYLFVTLSQVRKTGGKWKSPALTKAGSVVLLVVYIGATLTIIIYNIIDFYQLV